MFKLRQERHRQPECVAPAALKIMSLEFLSPTEIERQRIVWFAVRAKSGMTFDTVLRLNDEALRLFPRTEEERRRKTKSLMAMPEFVL